MSPRSSPSPLRLIIHAGCTKCGSTSIQHALAESRRALAKAGIAYLPMRGRQDHYFLQYLWGKKSRGDHQVGVEVAEAWIASLGERLEELRPAIVLVSAENLFSSPPSSVIGVLKKHVNFEEIQIIVYVRDPRDRYISLVQQHLKGDHEFSAPSDHRQDIFTPVKRWLELPDTTVTVREFNSQKLVGGSVVKDFAALLEQCAASRVNLPDTRLNDSLSAEQMILIQHYRRDFLAEKAGRLNPRSENLVKFFERLNQSGEFRGTKPKLKPEIAQEVWRNNVRYAEELEGLLDIGKLSWTGENDSKAEPWKMQNTTTVNQAEVSTILDDCDSHQLEFLRSLVVEYEPSLESVVKNLGILEADLRARSAYVEYLKGAYAALS